jgi:hypothetical protein
MKKPFWISILLALVSGLLYYGFLDARLNLSQFDLETCLSATSTLSFIALLLVFVFYRGIEIDSAKYPPVISMASCAAAIALSAKAIYLYFWRPLEAVATDAIWPITWTFIIFFFSLALGAWLIIRAFMQERAHEYRRGYKLNNNGDEVKNLGKRGMTIIFLFSLITQILAIWWIPPIFFEGY